MPVATLTINKIAIVIENWDLSERLLLKVFWGSIRLLRQDNRDNFIREVFLFQDGCNALRASRTRKLESKYVLSMRAQYQQCNTYTIEFDSRHVGFVRLQVLEVEDDTDTVMLCKLLGVFID